MNLYKYAFLSTLQGIECAGQSLLIKFPDHPITHNGNVVIKKATGTTTTTTTTMPSNYQQQVLTQNAAKKGYVNSNYSTINDVISKNDIALLAT